MKRILLFTFSFLFLLTLSFFYNVKPALAACIFSINDTSIAPGDSFTVTINADPGTAWNINFLPQGNTIPVTTNNSGVGTYTRTGNESGQINVRVIPARGAACSPASGIGVSVSTQNPSNNTGNNVKYKIIGGGTNQQCQAATDGTMTKAECENILNSGRYNLIPPSAQGRAAYCDGPDSSGTYSSYSACEAAKNRQYPAATLSPSPTIIPPVSSIKCLNTSAPFCLTNQGCNSGDSCQIFNCRENDGVYRCLSPSTQCTDSDLTDKDRCLSNKPCDEGFSRCTQYACRYVSAISGTDMANIPNDWDIANYNLICTKDIMGAPDNPSPPPPPCIRGLDKDGKNTTDKDSIVNCKAVDTGLGLEIGTDPQSFIKNLFGLILSISGGIAVLLIIYSGYQLINSQGNPEKLEAARQQLLSAIIGLLFIIFSLVILQTIGVDILRIPGFRP